MDLIIRLTPIFVCLIGQIRCQKLYQVHMEELPAVRSGSIARFRCSYVGENVTIQYVSWTKIGNDARRMFVYEYSEHPPINKAYHDFIGRAVVKSEDNYADRYRRGEVTYKPNDQPANDRGSPREIGRGPLIDPRKATVKPDDDIISQIQRNMLEASGISGVSSSDMLRFNDFPMLASNGKTVGEDEGVMESVYGPGKENVVGEDMSKRSYIPVYHAGMAPVVNETKEPVETQLYRKPPSSGIYIPGASDAQAFQALMRFFSPTHLRRQRRSTPIGHIDLFLSDVRLEDEARYECTVKPVGGPALSNSILLNVQVAPSEPAIETTLQEPLVEGQNISLSCQGVVGKPAGRLSWSLMRKGDGTFSEVPDHLLEVTSSTLPNTTTMAISKLQVTVAEEDDGAVYRCTASSDIMGAYEARPFTQTTLALQYPPRGGRILFDTAVGRYYCHARGKPAPTYAWIWIQPDGRQTIMSTNRYLDLRGMRQSGYYRFHCLASNIINGVRHTKVMATKLRVIAPEDPTTTTEVTTTTEPPTTQEPEPEPSPVAPKFISRYGRYDVHESLPDHYKQYVAPDTGDKLQDPTPTALDHTDKTTITSPHTDQKSEGFYYEKQETRNSEPSATGYYDENLRQARLPESEDADHEEEEVKPTDDSKKSYDDYREGRGTTPTAPQEVSHRKEPEKKESKDGAYYYYYYNTDDDKYSNYEDDNDKKEKQKPEGRQASISHERSHDQAVEQSHERSYGGQTEEEEEYDPAAYTNDFEMVSRSSHSEYNCKERGDGVYGAGCRAFFRCLNKRGYFVECKKPYVYNRRAGKCDKPDLAPAPCGIWRDCSNRKSMKYADVEFDCKNYFTCWHGFFMGHNECNPGLVFNQKIQLCDWPENVPAPCGKGKARRKTRRNRA